MAKRALASPKAWRVEAGKGNRYLERKAYRLRKQQPVHIFQNEHEHESEPA